MSLLLWAGSLGIRPPLLGPITESGSITRMLRAPAEEEDEEEEE